MPRPIHFEINAREPERLVHFYANVFGWKFSHIPQFDYWLIETGSGDGINGGLMKRIGPSPLADSPVNAFVCSLGVDSVDTYLDKALAAGGRLALGKMAIPGIGWQAYVKDPDENIVGLHQPDANAQ